jgi:hypothetical protein
LPYDISSSEKAIWIDTGGSKKIADVYFFNRKDNKVLVIRIDKDGQVINHEIAPCY